jgi:hypothetical protein
VVFEVHAPLSTDGIVAFRCGIAAFRVVGKG